MPNQIYIGSCHCGGIRYQFEGPEIVSAMKCTCSICDRKGALLTDFTVPKNNITIEAAAGQLRDYKFNTGVATHHFCDTCGIFTFVETRLNPGEYRFNLGCLEGVDMHALPVEVFDGDSI